VMVVAVNPNLSMLAASPRQKARLQEIAKRWPLETLLAALQVLAEARGRLRGSPHGRTLVEIAILRVALLDNLTELGDVVSRLAALEVGAPPVSTAEKKKLTPDEIPAPTVPPTPSNPEPSPALPAAEPVVTTRAEWDLARISEGWKGWLESQSKELSSRLVYLKPTALPRPDLLVIEPILNYNHVVDACEKSDLQRKIETSLRQWLDRPLTVQFQRHVEAPTTRANRHPEVHARDQGLKDEPLHEQLVELFEARIVKIEVDEDPISSES
jgi:DNA polymerase-3 subunit gamma/tau